jgi:carbon monoxide dehydrogenase subunit G
MKVSGQATLHAAVDTVYATLHDPAVLVRTIPGCERLEQVGPDAYRMAVSAGVAAIKGTYAGDVRLTPRDPPNSFLLTASGSGAPGTVSAEVRITLAESDGGTVLTYDADAVVGGPVGGVGQRILAGVAKKTAGEFFAAVDDVLTGAPVEAGAPVVFTRPAAGPRVRGDFARGVAFGAAAALLGVVVGALIGRRAR